MTPTDIKVAAALRKLDGRRIDVKPEVPEIFPLLLGSDRIFVGEYFNQNFIPTTVEVNPLGCPSVRRARKSGSDLMSPFRNPQVHPFRNHW